MILQVVKKEFYGYLAVNTSHTFLNLANIILRELTKKSSIMKHGTWTPCGACCVLREEVQARIEGFEFIFLNLLPGFFGKKLERGFDVR